MSDEFRCCHGTPETGHSATCPYDKLFFGPRGVDWGSRQAAGPACAIDFHQLGLKQHGENSAYAKTLREQAKERLLPSEANASLLDPSAPSPDFSTEKERL